MIGFIGGTGREGRGLALRFALAGEQVIIGSRDRQRACQAAELVGSMVPSVSVEGALNWDVAQKATIVFIAVPYDAHSSTLMTMKEQLAGKIVVDVVAPLAFSNGHASAIPVKEGSAALQAQSILVDSTVVAAFHTISAHDLLVPDMSIDSDVVVCADDRQAKERVMELAEKIQGIRAVNGGGLTNAFYVEVLTALLLNINIVYKAHAAIKIAGI